MAKSEDFELLAEQIDAVTKRLDAAEARRDDQERALQEALEALQEINERLGLVRPKFMLSPWWWPSMRQGEAREAWQSLTTWVEEVLMARYGKRERTSGNLFQSTNIKACWFAHSDVVDLLSGLHWAWRRSHAQGADRIGPIDWHLDKVPKALEQIRSRLQTCVGGCTAIEGNPKSGDLTWKDRERFIAADIKRRDR